MNEGGIVTTVAGTASPNPRSNNERDEDTLRFMRGDDDLQVAIVTARTLLRIERLLERMQDVGTSPLA